MSAQPPHFLALDGAKLITGDVMYIDGGYHIID
jgi:enoyl-[acyl-carrier protein] reductase I